MSRPASVKAKRPRRTATRSAAISFRMAGSTLALHQDRVVDRIRGRHNLGQLAAAVPVGHHDGGQYPRVGPRPLPDLIVTAHSRNSGRRPHGEFGVTAFPALPVAARERVQEVGITGDTIVTWP